MGKAVTRESKKEKLAALAELEDRDMIAALEAKGFQVTVDHQTHRQIKLPGTKKHGTFRFGVASDTHFGHKHQQPTHLFDFCTRAAEYGVDFMLHGGDVVDGTNMHRDQQYELFKHGSDAQADCAAELLPEVWVEVNGVLVQRPWYAIGGNHDGSHWNSAGANTLRTLATARPDFHFLGAPGATFNYGGVKIDLLHPDGGSAYARSYKVQKIIEGYEPDSKPHILLCGHWHIQNHVAVRNVHGFALPCFQAQTAYIKRKGLFPVIGGYLFEVEYNELGPTAITPTLVTYANPVPHDY